MPTVGELLSAIDKMAPWQLAESWDQVGLQVGDSGRPVQKVLVALELNELVLKEGLAQGVQGFILHHPLIFKPLTRILTNTPNGALLSELIKNDLFLIAAHTNIDKAASGLNNFLATTLGLTDVKPLTNEASLLCKVVVFLPETALDDLRNAMSQAGAGVIGEYTECSFEIAGTGTFKPGESARPTIGTAGIFEKVPEIRLEMIAPQAVLPKLIKLITKNHPYQEPAIDIYPLLNNSEHGLGKIGSLVTPVSLRDLCLLIKERLSIRELRVSGDPGQIIKRIAICSGSGGSLTTSVIRTGADLYLTGEMGYHDILNARDNRLAVIEAGHWGTEKSFIPLIFNYLTDYYKNTKDFQVIPSNTIKEEPYLII